MVHDSCGAVFTPAGRAKQAVYSFGPEGKKDHLLTCPVSGIPEGAFELLRLWRECRLLKCLPVAGGYVDQPLIVRAAFPIFEAEMQLWEAANGGPERTAALAVGAMFQAMGRG